MVQYFPLCPIFLFSNNLHDVNCNLRISVNVKKNFSGEQDRCKIVDPIIISSFSASNSLVDFGRRVKIGHLGT